MAPSYIGNYRSAPNTRRDRHHRNPTSSGSQHEESSALRLLDEPPTARPPSIYHSFRGNVKTQDIFGKQIERLRRKGEKHRVLYPGSDDFEMERMDMWNHDAICTPALILQPRNSHEVSSCIRGYTSGVHRCLWENKRRGQNHGIPRLCIAGGRHSMQAMKEGAIVLDLSLMRSVTFDYESQTATVQGGARIVDVDHRLGQDGMMCVTGADQNLGVVGCILAGGFGYASRKYGLACDNVVGAQVVLGDGCIRSCSPSKRSDLFWSICGGGGGIAVVTKLKLRCYPLQNSALLNIASKTRSDNIREWASWISQAPNEVFSEIIIQTSTSAMSCVATSIDTDVIPQSEAMLERFVEIERRNSKRSGLFGFGKRGSEGRLPLSWERIPGLDTLKSMKFASKVTFQMLRYFDGLQATNSEMRTHGNHFISFKYAKDITPEIAQLILEATTGKVSPRNDSRIVVYSLGGAIAQVPEDRVSFGARGFSNFAIYIEGKWDYSGNDAQDEHERKKVISWVQWLSNQLNMMDDVRSTSHPESTRDLVSKSGRTKPPSGWYNFSEQTGTKLVAIKKSRDHRNVFSLASRVSWSDGPSLHQPLASHGDRAHSKEDAVSSADFGGSPRSEGALNISTSVSSYSNCSSESFEEDRANTSASGGDDDDSVGDWSIAPSMILDADYFASEDISDDELT